MAASRKHIEQAAQQPPPESGGKSGEQDTIAVPVSTTKVSSIFPIPVQFAAIPRFSIPKNKGISAAAAAARVTSYNSRSPSPTRKREPAVDVGDISLANAPIGRDVEGSDIVVKLAGLDHEGNADEDEEMLDNEIKPIFNESEGQPQGPSSLTVDDKVQRREATAAMEPHGKFPVKRPRLMPPKVEATTAGTKQQAPSEARPRSRFLVPPSPSSPAFLAPPSNKPGTHGNNISSPTRPIFLRPNLPSAAQLSSSSSSPAFIPPPSSSFVPPTSTAGSQQVVEQSPLPEAFSPHRKGQRFVAGGMAVELSAWVIETGSLAVSGRRGKGYLRGMDFMHKVRVLAVDEGDGEEKGSGKIRFVRGVGLAGDALEREEGEVVGIMLVDCAGERGTVGVGDVVGIRAPSWDVCNEIEGREGKWVVGVDWRIIQG